MTNKIFVAGHRGMVGSSLLRLLKKQPNVELLTRSHAELDLINQADNELSKEPTLLRRCLVNLLLEQAIYFFRAYLRLSFLGISLYGRTEVNL